MTIKCFFLGCIWKTAVKHQGVETLHSQICSRCGAHRTISE